MRQPNPVQSLPVSAIPHTPMDDLCLDFVNSLFQDHRGTGALYDRLGLRGWWIWLVRRWGLRPCAPPDPAQVAGLRRLRTLCRRLLEDGVVPTGRDRAVLNRVLAAAPNTWHLAGGTDVPEISLRPVASGVPAVAAAIVVSLVEVIAANAPRIHRCENPDCSFLFRDTSRNGSRRWCDPGICGNLVNVRAFRAGRVAAGA